MLEAATTCGEGIAGGVILRLRHLLSLHAGIVAIRVEFLGADAGGLLVVEMSGVGIESGVGVRVEFLSSGPGGLVVRVKSHSALGIIVVHSNYSLSLSGVDVAGAAGAGSELAGASGVVC